jgi:5,6,7,8-tetrahydromethanopterin hydro-lyase
VGRDDLDHDAPFGVHREATAKASRKVMRHEPSIDWLRDNRDKVQHDCHQLGLWGEP